MVEQGEATRNRANVRNERQEVPFRSPPWAAGVVLGALLLVVITFLVTILSFKELFDKAESITTALASLFGVVGALVGAYFGIKSSGDAINASQIESDKARSEVAQANQRTNQALAALPPEEGKRIMDERES
jgi:amino acid permease